MKMITNVKELLKVVDAIKKIDNKMLILFPLTEEENIYVIESSDLNPETLKFAEKNELVTFEQMVGTWGYSTFFELIKNIPGATIKNDAKIYEVPCNIWYEAAKWDEDYHIRPNSVMFGKEIKCYTTFGYGRVHYIDKDAHPIATETKGEVSVEENKEKLRIWVHTTTTYSWEYAGKKFTDVRSGVKTFSPNKEIDIYEKNSASVVENWQDPAHAVMYSLDIDGNCFRWISKGVVVSYKKYDAGSWSSSDGMLFGSHDEREYESHNPVYGEREMISLNEVPEEVKKDKDWAALEKLVFRGGREYKEKLIQEYNETSWKKIKKEAKEYIDSLQ